MFRSFETVNSNELENIQISTVISNLEKLAKQDCRYHLTINKNYDLEGKIVAGTNSIIYQGMEYINIYNKLYSNQDYQLVLVENILESNIKLEYLTLENIYSLIKDLNPDKKEVYSSDFELVYYVYDSKLVTLEQLENVEIKIIGNNKKITKIEMNYLTDNYMFIIKE